MGSTPRRRPVLAGAGTGEQKGGDLGRVRTPAFEQIVDLAGGQRTPGGTGQGLTQLSRQRGMGVGIPELERHRLGHVGSDSAHAYVNQIDVPVRPHERLGDQVSVVPNSDWREAPSCYSKVSVMIRAAPPVAKLATSAPAAWPSGEPIDAWNCAMSSKTSSAMRWY